MALVYLSCAWVLGIFLGAKFVLPLAFIFTGLIPLVLLCFSRQHTKAVILTSLCIAIFFAGGFYSGLSQPKSDTQNLQYYNDQGSVKIRGTVNQAPETRDKNIHLYLKATGIQINQKWQEVSGTVLIVAPRHSSYRYGDLLQIIGEPRTPPQFDDFDYREYLAHHQVYSIMFYPEMEVLETGKGAKPLEWIYSLRNNLSQSLTKVLSEPQAALAQGIILGLRGNIPQEVRDSFTRSGTAHILAISGLHLAIVAGILLSTSLWLFGRRRYIYVWLALGGVWFYAIITGLNPPVLRGAIMASLFLLAQPVGRQRSTVIPLALAAAVMVGLSPPILWDASFQLSFLAMAGLILIFPPLQSLSRRFVKAKLGEDGALASLANFTGDSLSVTLGALAFVWPVIAYYFGIISLASPLATLLVLPALPAVIATGALAAFSGLLILPLAQVIGWLSWLFLSYILVVAGGFAAIPASFIEVEAKNVHLIWIYYLGLGLALLVSSHYKQTIALGTRLLVLGSSAAGKIASFFPRLPPKWVIPPLAVVAVLVWIAALSMPDGRLHVSFLDVGDGDAILIQTPLNQDILIDGGPSPQKITTALGKKMPFWDRTIDLVVSTHPHEDHLTGLVEVIKRYRVKEVLYPNLEFQSPTYNEWLKAIKEKEISSTLAQAGQKIALGGGASICVLNPQTPPLAGTEDDVNNNALVSRLSMGDLSFLFTADIQQEAETELINSGADLASTVLKVAHHGSETSTTDEFLKAANPRLAVISVASANPFVHPSDEVLERLKERLGQEYILRTDANGTVEFITDGERLWVETEK